MQFDKTINLLLTIDDVDEANRLVSLLRNSNLKIDPHYINGATELNKKLQERNWDLVISELTGENIPAKTIIHQIRRSTKDIPVILTTPWYNPEAVLDGLRLGAAEVAPIDQDQQVIQYVSRALRHLEDRRQLRYWKRRFAESESRFEQLILSSQDGIAIIQEGTYVDVNDAYAHLFGYLDREAMTLLPVFDSISKNSQGHFKPFLKPLDPENAIEPSPFQFEGLHSNGTPFLVRATISQIEFHGEQSLELLIKKELLYSSDTASKQTESLQPFEPGRLQLNEMIGAINGAIHKAVRHGEDTLLCYIQVDQYDDIQKKYGLVSTEEAINKLALFLDSYVGGQSVFGRIREDAFIHLLSNADNDQGLAFADAMAQAVSEQVFTTTEHAITTSIKVGITKISELSTAAESCLEECLAALNTLNNHKASDSFSNRAFIHTPVIEVSNLTFTDDELRALGRKILKEKLAHLAFQPIISLHGDSAQTYEVLMRIDAETFGEDVPEDFIQRVLRTEIGRDLDQQVILTAIPKLEEKNKTSPDTRLFINLSEATLSDTSFSGWLKDTLAATSLKPSHLVFQVREIDIGNNLERTANLLQTLKNMGLQSSLSHFGLSINPLQGLNKLHVDFLKLDGLLVENVQKDKEGLSALKLLIDQIKPTQCKVIVPFIETPTIIPTLWQAGVDYLQGFYFQPPRPEMDFEFETSE